MLNTLFRRGKGAIAALAVALLAACGGGGGGGDDTPAPAPGTGGSPVSQALSSAAATASNDTATNTSSSFAVLQSAGVPAVQVQATPKVNFAVFSDGRLVNNLQLSNVSFLIAKLVPGTDGNQDQWVSYTYRTESTASGANRTGPNGVPVLASARQATSDPKQTDPALAAQQLVLNPDGYYTYTFRTDIRDPARTTGVVFEPNRTHRVAIQLSYVNAAGETVRVNPYFDFTVDANGNAVALTNPATQTRKMTDVGSCNQCHEKIALHGGGRVDTQFCVMCHNPGTTDANSGNVLNMSTMVHKIHAGKLLKKALTDGKGGEIYTIWGFNAEKHDYSEVGFPQDLRNCTKCHTSANPSTPQGDNWKSKPTKEACLACHAAGANSEFEVRHLAIAASLQGAGARPQNMPNSLCAGCHAPGSAVSPERVHFNQNEEHSARYRMNIESAVYDATTRKVTVKYFLSDPTNNNAAYNLVTPECTAAAPNICANTSKFGNLRVYLAYQSIPGQQPGVTEFTSNGNGGGSVFVPAYQGTNDGSNHYTVQLTVPPDTATHVVQGTGRVLTLGAIKEPLLQVKWPTDPRPEVTPRTLINVVAQNASLDIPLTGPLQPRRQVVSNEKCNACHGALGTTSGSNTLADAFHGGARNTVEACVMCHDPLRMSNSTKMTNGLDLNESYQFKRMIHGIHGNSKRTFPFTHGNSQVGAFNMDGTSRTGGAPLAANVENYAAEVAWPGVGINCTVCHVNNSYLNDQGTIGSVVKKPTGVTDPRQWLVISPKAATCTACHDSPAAMGHVTSFGNASFGNRTLGETMFQQETCNDCHASGGFKGVDIVHGLK